MVFFVSLSVQSSLSYKYIFDVFSAFYLCIYVDCRMSAPEVFHIFFLFNVFPAF
jgi:hypothetical protein